MTELNVVGKKLEAVGARDVVTGKAVYCPDLEFSNMLVGKLLYSPHPRARITRLDVTKARSIPGVAAVLTAKDIPGENNYFYWYADQPVLADGEVRYRGDAIAAVAAETEEIALAALEAIQVEYEPLEGVFDPLTAMQPDSPRVWPEKENIQSHYVNEWGDLEAGFDQADIIIENTYTTQYIEHAMLETEGSVAYVDADGMVVVYASTQAPHRDRFQIARVLGIPEMQVREIAPRIGGAFGAKDEANVQVHVALLALKTGRPVRIIRSREESIRTHVKRHPSIIKYRTGATKDGKLTAVHMVAVGDTGPYVNAGEEVIMVMANSGAGPYYIPNVRSEAYAVHTNNPICGAMRGFGIPQVTFAYESQMDELARRLNIDPLEIRQRNELKTGQQFQPKAVLYFGDGLHACLEKVSQLEEWKSRDKISRRPAPHLRRGWGVAASYHKVGFGPGVSDYANAAVEMARDGSVLVRTGASDMGQGAHTVMAQFAAEHLGVTPDTVKVIRPDTAVAADAGAAVASRTTTFSGNAVIKAAEPIRKVLLDLAAKELGTKKEQLELSLGYVYVEGERVNLTVSSLAAMAYEQNLPMQSSGYYAMDYPEATLPDGSPGYKHRAAFGAQVAQVLVDIETGELQVEWITTVNDVGQVVNPGGVRGQMEGAVSMGFGYSLFEELHVEGGNILNGSLESYLIPTIMDVPEIRVGIVEAPEPGAPLGAKGVGEPPLNLVAAALANAVRDATGISMRQLPLTPERILEAIQFSQKEV